MRVQEDAETPLMTEGSLPPPPNAFTEAEALRWPSIRAALSEETGARVGQGLAVRVVRGYGGRLAPAPPRRGASATQGPVVAPHRAEVAWSLGPGDGGCKVAACPQPLRRLRATFTHYDQS